MPISPAAQKFRRLILCSHLDSSVISSNSSVPGLTRGRWHIAEANQKIAEPHPAMIAAVSISDLIMLSRRSWMMVSVLGTAYFR
jgi:hypothetical protein